MPELPKILPYFFKEEEMIPVQAPVVEANNTISSENFKRLLDLELSFSLMKIRK